MANYIPSHFYWDGRCFPSYCTSFGIMNVNVNNSPIFNEEEEIDNNTYDVQEEEQDNPTNYIWDDVDEDDWQSVENNKALDILEISEPTTREQESYSFDQKPIKEEEIKLEEFTPLNSVNSSKFDMILLLQKHSYYYLATQLNCGDRFADLENDDIFLINLPSQTISASKKILVSESIFFKVMIESQMREANENQVDFSSLSNEEELDIVKILNYLRYGHVGVPMKGTAYPKNLKDFGSNLIGIVDLLRLLDVADKFGVFSFIVGVASILNQYNVMIILGKALEISPELGTILVDACVKVIADYLPCVLGGLIYEGVIDQFLEKMHSNTEEWIVKCKESYTIFKAFQDDIKCNTRQRILKCTRLKTHPTVAYMVDVLPSDIFFKILDCTSQIPVDDILGLITVWIMSGSFDTCFQDYSSLENLESDNIIYRLREGITFALDKLCMQKIAHTKSLFLLLLPMIRYFSRSYPSDFQELYSRYVVEMTDPSTMNRVGYPTYNSFTYQVVSPMLKKCFNNHPVLPKTDLTSLFSQFFIDSTDNSDSIENAERIIPQILSMIMKEGGELENEFAKFVTASLFKQFSTLEQSVQSNGISFKKTESNIINPFSINMFGLDESGKTLLLEKMKAPESDNVVQTFQTIGFNSECILFGRAPMKIVDVGGSKKLRGLWKNFVSPNTPDLLIMVVDLSNRERFQEAKLSFDNLMSNINTVDNTVRPLSILLLANKSDCIPDKKLRATLESELYKIFESSPYLSPSHLLDNHYRFKFMTCSAKTGEGIDDIWFWFLEDELMGHYSVVDQLYFTPLPSSEEWLV